MVHINTKEEMGEIKANRMERIWLRDRVDVVLDKLKNLSGAKYERSHSNMVILCLSGSDEIELLNGLFTNCDAIATIYLTDHDTNIRDGKTKATTINEILHTEIDISSLFLFNKNGDFYIINDDGVYRFKKTSVTKIIVANNNIIAVMNLLKEIAKDTSFTVTHDWDVQDNELVTSFESYKSHICKIIKMEMHTHDEAQFIRINLDTKVAGSDVHLIEIGYEVILHDEMFYIREMGLGCGKELMYRYKKEND